MSHKTLILGARGNVGSKIASLLKAKGHELALATHQQPQTPEQVHLNLQTGEGLETAFEGVERAFLLSPPGDTQQDKSLNPVIDLARQHGLKKVVLMTAMGADADPSSPFRKAELHLEQSGLNYNIIRPNWFMQNFNSYWLAGIKEEGKILLPVGNATGSFIDTHDIAAVAAQLLDSDQFNNQAFVLTGSEALDHDQVAEILSQVTGKAIQYQEITPAVMRERLLAAGLPADYAEFMLVILDFFKQGYSAQVSDAVQTITGKAPIGFAAYADAHRQAWL